MTTQAAAQAAAQAGAAAANGAAAASQGALGAPAIKKEVSPVPDGKAAHAAAAAAAGPGSRGGTPAADGQQGSASASPAPAAAAGAAATEAAAVAGAAGDAAPSKEDEEQRRLEDEILAEGQAIAGVRALLAKAFSRPAEEPAAPRGHWSFLLQEAQWLANDMAQERLWKQAAALAIGYEVAKLRGKFGLWPPPEGQRKYHDEIAALRAAAAKDGGGAAADKAGGGRRGRSVSAGEANGAAAAGLKLEPSEDPVFREFGFAAELALPGTPPNDDLTAALTFQHDDAFQEALAQQLVQSDVERMMREEMALREYRFEYDAALASHHMAVQEQNRRAMRLDADMADAEGLVPMDEDVGDEEEYAKKAKGRKRPRSGYLLDEFASLGAGAADETESVGGGPPKKAASGAAGGANRQFIEDTYLKRKQRRERYKDVDVDYDVGMENAARYGTRANRQLANRAGATRAQDPKKRQQQLGRPEAYAALPGGGGGAMVGRAGQRAQAGAVQGVLWNKQEDELLLAITHEFGVNWTMVSEVLSLSLSMQGVYRPPHLCKQRFRQVTTPMLQQHIVAAAPPGHEMAAVDYSEEKALAALYHYMSKQQARELIVQNLPVSDDVMMRMLEALVQVGATAKQRRQLEEKRNEQNRKIQDPHLSHQTVHQQIMAKTGGKHLTPQELAVQVDVAYAQQEKQRQVQLQQAQQAAQLQQQQAAAPPPPGQQAAQAPAAQGMPAPAPGVAAGTPAGAPALGAVPGAPAGAQQPPGLPAAGTPPLPAGTPPLQAMGVAPGQLPQQQPGMPPPQQQQGAPMPSPAGVAGHPAGPRPGQPQITLQQLNHILETGKLPNGQPLEPQMRKAIEDKKNAYLAQMAMQQQRQMMQQQQQMAAAGAPGAQPSAATQAALQAAQQAAAVQAGMRPPMPMAFRPAMPGQHGMPGAGMPGQPMPGQPGMQGMAMQPALLQQQMAAMAGNPGAQMGMQAMQPGMQLNPAAQQQLIAQQFAMQQQAAAAAAQQQAAAAAAAAQPGAPQPGG
ncbi:hypothetical protein ABPG75_000406 [Micractinium tetrahymenae]